jgi:stage II sporulation protein D
LCARWSLGERLVRLRPIDTDAAGRWLTVEVAGDARTKQMAFEDFRRALGPGDLQSSRVVRTWPRPGDPIAQGMLFEGRGRGHGVGLCQRGALALARQGWSAERILAHYYPGAAIVDFR